MVNFKINIQKRLYEDMKKYKQVNWNSVAKKGLKEKLKKELKDNKEESLDYIPKYLMKYYEIK